MKNLVWVIFLTLTSLLSLSQSEKKNGITMNSDYGSDNTEIADILQFEGIEYMKLSFQGRELADKSYRLSAKEIWNGEIKSDSIIIDSKTIQFEQLQKINDTVFNLKIISKLTHDSKLKMTFNFPNFSAIRKFDAINSEDYSLRNVVGGSGTEIKYGEKFYLLAYILPYEKDGLKYWCAVENSGEDIENWGKEFGIEHYIVFEMIFE